MASDVQCRRFVVRRLIVALSLISCWGPLQGATLERLSLDDMIAKSTAIVRGKVTGSHAAFAGDVIYTHYQVQVLERWKGSEQASVEFVVPGGTVGRVRQASEGVPQIGAGKEYVLFLWTSRAGLTYIIGFSQGLFSLPANAGAESLAVREATADTVLERGTGRMLRGERIQMRVRDLRTKVSQSLSQGASQ